MKRLFQFVCLLTAVAWMAACSESSLPADNPLPDDPSTPDVPDEPIFEGDTVAVRIAATSLEWDAQPMSRAGGNDLYGIMVYQAATPLYDDDYNIFYPPMLIAVAVFDDPSLITLKLVKSQYYFIRMTYVPNGKNVIASRGTNKWGCPFYMPFNDKDLVLNEVQYNPTNGTFLDMPSQAAGQTEWMSQYNSINEVLRYEGLISNFQAAENGALATIPLYRWQYGIRITVTDFKEGTVYYSYSSPESRKITLTPNASGTSTTEHLLEYAYPGSFRPCENSAEYADKYLYGVNFSVKIGYITPSGEDILLWTSGYPFKRMHMHVLEFSLSDAIANGGIRPELMESADEPMTESKWEF